MTDRRPTPPLTPVAELPSALDDFAGFTAALEGRTPAIFLDYDGTLTPIVARPEDAVLDPAGRAIVAELAKRLPVAVVSGRDRPDVEKLVGIDGLIYAGSHGFDVTIPGHGTLDHEGIADLGGLLDSVEAHLRRHLDPIAGALIERKKFSIAAHYRQVAEADYPAFRAGLDQVLASFSGIKEKPGKKVFEFQPAIDWDKGKCVRHLRQALELNDPAYCPLFFGDDVTDEDAFKALPDFAGFGVLCAPADWAEDDGTPKQSYARFRLDDPAQVLAFLDRLGR
ncbi:trehalose-phosphatase [Roseospirillum parvum]|uniref:Trehalose 6-phosphate phosphatase n=1 Tax=Roseospirillum parvum TaxID=83401 RepID=A0A1G8CNH3_9PROT|nr:trehalose-phosphatase [Roseospirillum parvum]SDH47058.1 trehalose 6-phosphate phosphatase [Roseospirillum parvum]